MMNSPDSEIEFKGAFAADMLSGVQRDAVNEKPETKLPIVAPKFRVKDCSGDFMMSTPVLSQGSVRDKLIPDNRDKKQMLSSRYERDVGDSGVGITQCSTMVGEMQIADRDERRPDDKTHGAVNDGRQAVAFADMQFADMTHVELQRRNGDGNRQFPMRDNVMLSRSPRPYPGCEMGKPLIRPNEYDGSSPWNDYLVQFEMIADLNAWDDNLCALYLAASLRGSAQAILGDLDGSRRRDYRALVAALGRRFGSGNQSELFRAILKNKTRKTDETLQQMAQDIRRLTKQAYPDASYEMLEALSKDHFIDALLDSDTRWRVYQSRPQSLDDAVVVAVELEAFLKAEKRTTLRRGVHAVQTNPEFLNTSKMLGNDDKMQTQILQMSKELGETLRKGFNDLRAELKEKQGKRANTGENDKNQGGRRHREHRKSSEIGPCWNCDGMGHIRRNCPEPLREVNDRATRQGNSL